MTEYRWTSETDLVRHDTGERITRGEPFEPTDHERRQWPDRMVEQAAKADGVCTTEKNDGEICGRALPCRYHSEEDEGEDNTDE
jgi:hypothetical protein